MAVRPVFEDLDADRAAPALHRREASVIHAWLLVMAHSELFEESRLPHQLQTV